MKTKKPVNRRGFVRTTLLGTAGTLAATGFVKAEMPVKVKDEKKPQKFITRKLGNTDMVLPVVSMGVMRADNPNLIRAALDKGMKLLDTAHTYQGGRNEEMLGKLLKDYPRDSYYIETKVKPDGYDKKRGTFKDPARVETSFLKKFNTSMKRLGLDYVDTLFLHAISTREATLYKPVLKVMKKLKKEGRTRYLGVSTHSNEPQVIQAAIDSGVYDVVLVAYNFQQKHRDEMNRAIGNAAKAGLGIIAMKTMAGGHLDKEQQQPVNAKAALKWAMQNPHIATSIPGFTSFDQLDEDITVAADLTMTEKEKNELALATQNTLYCDGCSVCIDQCKKTLPIPDLMRAYMYTYGYGETKKARTLLDQLAIAPDVCVSCNDCTVSCIKGFPIAEKIQDVTRLVNVPEEFLT